MASTEQFDLIVIGGGPAGYVAAIRGAQLGFKTACVEKSPALGGTCLNVGCIPSKALLESSEHFIQAKTKFAKHGIQVGEVTLDLAAMMKRKDSVVRQLTGGIAGLFKKHQVTWVNGHGKFNGAREVERGPEGTGPREQSNECHVISVEGQAGSKSISAPRILIATGSEPVELPFLKFDRKRVVDSTGALALPEVPKHLVVIGGGVIGLEMGSVWARLGARVTVIEFLDRIANGFDLQAAKELQKSLTKQGIEFRLSTKCLGAKVSDSLVLVEAEDMANQTKFTLEADYVLVSTGRRPYTANLGLETIGIERDKAGRVPIDEHFRTSAPGVYAVGDVVVGPMLAHKAEEEGIAAVEIMAGQAGHVNYQAIPGVVYTHPELASVGYSEEDLKAKGIAYKAGSFPFLANGRAKAMEDTEGFVKILADAQTDRVLGAAIVGARAGDLIAEIVSVIEFGGSAEDIARTCHAHPSLPEIVKEAAMNVGKWQIHF